MENAPTTKRRIQKPIGLYILTIVLFLRLGFFQLLSYWFEIKNADGDVPFTIVFVSFFFTVFTAASAIWAFYGDNLGRIFLLIFVSLNVLWWMFLIIGAIANNESRNLEWLNYVSRLVQPTLILCVTWWYLTKSDVVAYFKQNS